MRSPEAKIRSGVAAAGVGWSEKGGPRPRGSRLESPPDPGKRRVPPGRSEARCGHPATGKNLETCQSGPTPAAT